MAKSIHAAWKTTLPGAQELCFIQLTAAEMPVRRPRHATKIMGPTRTAEGDTGVVPWGQLRSTPRNDKDHKPDHGEILLATGGASCDELLPFLW